MLCNIVTYKFKNVGVDVQEKKWGWGCPFGISDHLQKRRYKRFQGISTTDTLFKQYKKLKTAKFPARSVIICVKIGRTLRERNAIPETYDFYSSYSLPYSGGQSHPQSPSQSQ